MELGQVHQPGDDRLCLDILPYPTNSSPTKSTGESSDGVEHLAFRAFITLVLPGVVPFPSSRSISCLTDGILYALHDGKGMMSAPVASTPQSRRLGVGVARPVLRSLSTLQAPPRKVPRLVVTRGLCTSEPDDENESPAVCGSVLRGGSFAVASTYRMRVLEHRGASLRSDCSRYPSGRASWRFFEISGLSYGRGRMINVQGTQA
jgi:hypothetical protein